MLVPSPMPPATTPRLAPRPAGPNEWTAAMRRTVDNADYTFRVYEVAPAVAQLLRALPHDGVDLTDLAADGSPRAVSKFAAEAAAVLADWSPAARYYVRFTRGGGVHAVGIVDGRVYYDRATGYGYDKTAAALAGMPLPGPGDWYLTDHSAMTDGAGYPGPYGGERRAVMVHRGGYLPSHLVLK